MTETVSGGSPPTERPSIDPSFDNKDWFLLEYVRLSEVGVEQGLTITIGGIVVTGMLISGKAYFNLLADELLETVPEGHQSRAAVEILAENYRNFAQEVSEPVEADKEKFDRNYIHLKDARIVQGNTHIPSRIGVLWRGKVSSVDSFINGQMHFD